MTNSDTLKNQVDAIDHFKSENCQKFILKYVMVCRAVT